MKRKEKKREREKEREIERERERERERCRKSKWSRRDRSLNTAQLSDVLVCYVFESTLVITVCSALPVLLNRRAVFVCVCVCVCVCLFVSPFLGNRLFLARKAGHSLGNLHNPHPLPLQERERELGINTPHSGGVNVPTSVSLRFGHGTSPTNKHKHTHTNAETHGLTWTHAHICSHLCAVVNMGTSHTVS